MSVIRKHADKRAVAETVAALAAAEASLAKAGHRLYRSRRWQALRLQIIARDRCCTECGARSRLEVHHVRRVRDDPAAAFDPDNLQTLCGVCHARQTRHEVTGKVEDPQRAKWRAAVRAIERQEHA